MKYADRKSKDEIGLAIMLWLVVAVIVMLVLT